MTARACSRWRRGWRRVTMTSCTISSLMASGMRRNWSRNCSFRPIALQSQCHELLDQALDRDQAFEAARVILFHSGLRHDHRWLQAQPFPRTPVTPATFATQNLRPRDQLQAWQEWFAPVFDISPMEQAEDGFSAKNVVWSLGDISISRVLAPSVHVKRAKANLAKAPIDHWVLTYCRQGATNVQTPKGEFDATEGVPFLWSFGEQFESKRTRRPQTKHPNFQ